MNQSKPTKLETAVTSSRELRPRTKELYLQHVRAFLAFAGTAAGDWTSESAARWRDDMRERKIRPQSVNVALNALRFASTNAGLKFVDDVERLEVHKKAPSPRRETALTWAEGRDLVMACSGSRGRDLRDKAIITLGLRTGMLRFSLCQLRIRDVTYGRDARAQKVVPTLTFTKKGGDQHTIKLDPVTASAIAVWIDWLRTYLGISDNEHLFRSIGRARSRPRMVGEQAIAPVAVGKSLTPDGLYRALRERAKAAGLEDIQPHIFRNTFLYWAQRVGARPAQIAAVTGHQSDAIGDEDGNPNPPANLLLPPWTAKSLS